jgi:hypothetical protein
MPGTGPTAKGKTCAMDQLKAQIRVQALLRRCAVAGLMATVARKGDQESGALFLKVNGMTRGCVVYSGVSTPSGREGWHKATGPEPVSEPEADAYLARQATYDADLWVVEIEDPKGAFVIEAGVIEAGPGTA